MEENRVLISALREAGFTQAELAEAVNGYLREHGHDGTVSDRTVRHWLTGKTRWPHPRQREALRAVFGCTAEKLGFARAGTHSSADEPEQPVRRREFLTATTGTTAAIVAPMPGGRPTAVGTSEVIRLRNGLDGLALLDQDRGGHETLEQTALAGAAQALAFQKSAASQRIRQRLFSVAADYTATAAWSAIDARHPNQAQQHLERALYLAGMANDPTAELRVWISVAMLARERGNFAQAVDAALAAQSNTIARRDPFFASLAHVRTAIGHSMLMDRQAALRSLGHAEVALGKADSAVPRPSWATFYGPAELHALTAIVQDRVGNPARAEAAGHKLLLSFRPWGVGFEPGFPFGW
ncbi:helix-turn-helix domain-containing protein [Streptomyces sp. NBC_01476]|uniref:helix-turn-helix transcriptional regulator n=1 Tax=Streptomyces sp. NBC_01476 TaxID=2903881 RepID=UPI002E32C44B|nr:helix-turn-helix transcriptional regulator [Streptomyces sp. NBC_01476]